MIGKLSILNAIRGAAAILDESGNVLILNKRWNNPDVCSNWFNLEPDSENYFDHCKSAVETGNDYALRLLFGMREIFEKKKEYFNITVFENGSAKKWCKVEVTPVEDKLQNLALIVFHYISENMKTIQTLRESEAKYNHYFKHSTAGIILGKPDGEIIDVNPTACKMLGYSKNELIEGGRQLIVDESDPAHLEVVRIRGEKSIFEGEKEYIHKDGQFIPLNLSSVIYTFDDGSKHVLNTFQDLRKERKSKSTLEEERRFSKTALNSIPGIFIVVNSCRILCVGTTVCYRNWDTEMTILSASRFSIFLINPKEIRLKRYFKKHSIQDTKTLPER